MFNANPNKLSLIRGLWELFGQSAHLAKVEEAEQGGEGHEDDSDCELGVREALINIGQLEISIPKVRISDGGFVIVIELDVDVVGGVLEDGDVGYYEDGTEVGVLE